jgi:hypothetical protein
MSERYDPIAVPEDRVLVVCFDDTLVGRHHPASAYVERYWLPVLGPSCVLVARFLGRMLELPSEDGNLRIDIDMLSRCMGLGMGMHTGVRRPLGRLVGWGMARQRDDLVLTLRHWWPDVRGSAYRHLPETLQRELEPVTIGASA